MPRCFSAGNCCQPGERLILEGGKVQPHLQVLGALPRGHVELPGPPHQVRCFGLALWRCIVGLQSLHGAQLLLRLPLLLPPQLLLLLLQLQPLALLLL